MGFFNSTQPLQTPIIIDQQRGPLPRQDIDAVRDQLYDVEQIEATSPSVGNAMEVVDPCVGYYRGGRLGLFVDRFPSALKKPCQNMEDIV